MSVTDRRAVRILPRADDDRRLTADRRRAVLDGVLDERLHDHRRHSGAARAVLDAHVGLEPLAEPSPLDLEVRAHEIQLVVEHRPLAFGAAQRVAEDVGQLLNRAVRDGRVAMDQARRSSSAR